MHTVLERCMSRLHLLHQHAAATDHVAFDQRLCEACFLCRKVCPEGVLDKVEFRPHKHAIVRDPDACTGCLKCVKVCKAGALTPRAWAPEAG